ncbi:MAG: hypothetical protein EB120_13990 [Proteobacteria bacterium]|nr:hypothetical protein [Pseudomonadota bacterium]NDG28272.1 hypothetical protein [Pseudomonadota bacterium]
MNLHDHFESYRDSVSRDSLNGFVDFAKKLPPFDGYLRHLVGAIQKAVLDKDIKAYRENVLLHQEAAIDLFEMMVRQDLGLPHPEASKEEAQSVLKNTLGDILAKGWNWFKFSPLVVHMTNHTWIPRYSDKYEKEWRTMPCLNSDELRVVLETKPAPQIINSVFETKKQRPHIITNIDHGKINSVEMNKINDGVVRDWTMELFP